MPSQKEVADKVVKELLKKYEGNPPIYDSTKLIEKERCIVPVSPCIDLNIGGGILEGTFTILSGPPKVGKTVSALQIASNAQKLYGKYVYYFSIEGRIKPRDLLGVKDFNLDLCKIIQSEKGNILTAEDYLNHAVHIIKSHPGCVVILDSASALCSANEFSKEITATGRADGPKLLASFCRQMGGVVPANDVIVIIIQHLIANTSGYGQPYIEDGGQKIKYQFDTKLRCRTFKKWLETDENQIGNILTWEVMGSPLSQPGAIFDSYLRFGHGLDEEMELATVGIELGLISKAGAWYTLDFMLQNEQLMTHLFPLLTDSEKKRKALTFQGQEKTKNFLAEHDEVKKYLFERIKELS